MRAGGQKGQAILLVVVATGVLLIGALGLVMDGAQIYTNRQMAQVAADAAAQAGAMSLLGTSWSPGTGATIDCNSSGTVAPCRYATLNGFAATQALSGGACTASPGATCVKVETPTSYPGVNNLATGFSASLVQVTVTRHLNTGLMRLFGTTTAPVKAIAVAGLVEVQSPTPILVTHPNLAGALSMNGNTSIKICGGPTRSIEVNSCAPGTCAGTTTGGSAFNPPSSGTVDLSQAGPPTSPATAGTGACAGLASVGTGADFGIFGSPATAPSTVKLGTTGHYRNPAAPISDPYASVSAPAAPAAAPAVQDFDNSRNPSPSTYGCPALTTCHIYFPGAYPVISINSHDTYIFEPGVYYIQGGGFKLKNGTFQMCPPPTAGCVADTDTVNGMLVYNTGNGVTTATQPIDIDTNVTASLLGAGFTTPTQITAPAAPYYGILFFQDRNSDAQSHTIGQGNGCMDLVGTLYFHNLLSIMRSDATHYQSVSYNGTPCTTTIKQGNFVVNNLNLVGTSDLHMLLVPTATLKITQVALVH